MNLEKVKEKKKNRITYFSHQITLLYVLNTNTCTCKQSLVSPRCKHGNYDHTPHSTHSYARLCTTETTDVAEIGIPLSLRTSHCCNEYWCTTVRLERIPVRKHDIDYWCFWDFILLDSIISVLTIKWINGTFVVLSTSWRKEISPDVINKQENRPHRARFFQPFVFFVFKVVHWINFMQKTHYNILNLN